MSADDDECFPGMLKRPDRRLRSATRNPSSVIRDCTEFQLRAARGSNVIDYTERRLLRCVELAIDPQQALLLIALVEDYLAGHVVVAWRHGHPLSLPVTRDR